MTLQTAMQRNRLLLNPCKLDAAVIDTGSEIAVVATPSLRLRSDTSAICATCLLHYFSAPLRLCQPTVSLVTLKSSFD